MTEREQQKQDAYLRSNIQNLIDQADHYDRPSFSNFLDEREQELAREILRHNRWQAWCFYGGIEGCERQMLGVFPDGVPVGTEAFPLAALEVNVRFPDPQLNHRDYLGSLMALQIRREHLGDIVVEPRRAIVFVSAHMADFITQNLNTVGRCPVVVRHTSPEDLAGLTNHPTFEELQGTVSSLRLDCIVAFVLKKSRKIAEEVIASGKVKVNGLEALNGARPLSFGDKLSIRGSGRFILGEENKRTKKDRLFIVVRKLS